MAEWSDSKPVARKDRGKRRGHPTPASSRASVGKSELTVYRVAHSHTGEVWHAAINGKRISKAYKSIAEAKKDAEAQAGSE